MKRRFLLLQGSCSPFFDKLGQALRTMGHDIAKVNFNAGDSWYWNNGDKRVYRSDAEHLPDLYAELFDCYGYTDIVLFGDHRPVHRPAIKLARIRGLRVHVFEEGYFRPYWITLERDGVNAHSQLPCDPAWYRRMGPGIPDYGNGQPFASAFLARAWHDVVYHVAGIRNPLCYPGYRTHAPVSAAIEYPSYLRRAISISLNKRRDEDSIRTLIYGRIPFWLLPLQLNSDTQIRQHSPFANMQQLLRKVISSFARSCRPDAALVVKNHPLDIGLVNYRQAITGLCAEFNLPVERVVYLESGPLPALLNHTRGVITVNSTVGGSALVHSKPLIALGEAIYNMPGLTFQGPLDEFWRHGKRPDFRLFRWFRNIVIHTTQINGGFYSRSSIEMAVAGSIPRLLMQQSPVERLLRPDLQ